MRGAGEHGPGQPGHLEVILIPTWVPWGDEDSGHFRAIKYYDVGECPGHSEDHSALLLSELIFKAGPLTSPPHSQSPVFLCLHYLPLTQWLFLQKKGTGSVISGSPDLGQMTHPLQVHCTFLF